MEITLPPKELKKKQARSNNHRIFKFEAKENFRCLVSLQNIFLSSLIFIVIVFTLLGVLFVFMI
jgi:hypothetical protein